MKATGIVRRIDDLGRVVIPKEIRRTMRIREGDPLEIYTDRDGEVIFKKYSPVGELNAFASEYAETLHKHGELNVIITDRDSIIASAGVPRKEFADRQLSDELGSIIAGRVLYVREREGKIVSPIYDENGEESDYCICVAMPIISDGDVLGCVASVRPADEMKDSAPFPFSSADIASLENQKKVEIKLIQTAAAFLGRQLES